LAISPDGRLLASAGIDEIRLWHTATFEERGRIVAGTRGAVTSLVFAPESDALAAGYASGEIILWDPVSREMSETYKGHGRMVFGLAFSPDGRYLASGSLDESVKLWRTRSDEPVLTPQRSLSLLGAEVWTLAYSPDGRRLIWGGKTQDVAVCEPPTGTPKLVQLEGASPVIVFAPDGRTFAKGDWGGNVRIHNADTKQLISELKGSDENVRSLAYAPDGKTLAVGFYDGTTRIWELESRRDLPGPPRQSLPVEKVAYSVDGKQLIFTTGDWKRANKEAGAVTLWDLNAGSPRIVLRDHLTRVGALAVAPDGRTIATGGNDGIRIWDIEAHLLLASLSFDRRSITGLAYSPDGRLLACGHARGDIVIWEPAAFRKRAVLKGHQGIVSTLSFAPDGRSLASGSHDKSVMIWDVQSLSAHPTESPTHDDGGTLLLRQ
jgi:WD40 repeat protein